MTDSCFVFPPGERVTDDATGAPVIGGTVEFYDAGTTNPKTVFADSALSVALGTSVVTDSMGYPITGGLVRTLVYVGTARYKIVIKAADGSVLVTHDDIPGAVISASASDVSVTATFPVITKSLAYPVVAADQNTLFKVNCSSADVTLTLPSAVAVGAGWAIRVQHAGSANQALIATVSSQLISEGTKSYSTQMALSLNGEDVEIRSDGGNWAIVSHTSPFLKVAQGVLPITDRLSAPPVSPVQGALYLLTASPSGVWSGFAQHDIVQYHGGTTAWVNFTPYTDCGWLAFVADENIYYEFIDSAWVAESATSVFPGKIKVSTQAIMETATITDTAVIVGHQVFHPGHPKFWLAAIVTAGVPALSASYNMTSITDTGAGILGATIATDFSGVVWAALCSVFGARTSDIGPVFLTAKDAGTFTLKSVVASNGNGDDPTQWYAAGLGDQ